MHGLAETIPTDRDRYLSADDVPEIAAARQEAREYSWELVQERDHLLTEGREDELPISLDALSTADAAVEAKRNYGVDSEEFREKRAGLDLDCLRLVAEWRRKLRPEYYPVLRHTYDEATADFYSHGLAIGQMTRNALRPIHGNSEETPRRINEHVEHETSHVVKRIGGSALKGVGIRTISECTDWAIEDYKADQKAGRQHRGYDGYVPEIKKVMIRDIKIDEVPGDRLQEQVGLPGKYLTHFIFQEALRRRRVEAGHLDKTGLHGMQLLVRDNLMEFVALLDEVASEQWCTNIFMGEEVPEGYRKDYNAFREEALNRQEGLTDMAEKAATFVMDLAEDGFDRNKAPGHVEKFVKKLLLEEVKYDHQVAAEVFDEKTASGLQEVTYLESIGRFDEAFSRMQEIEKAAPGGGFCSGGSCGLESVDINSDAGKDLMKNLRAEKGDTIVKDKERACKCGAKTIAYAYNKGKVNKYCESCKAFESKQSSATAQQTQE